jgi:hypothetical protein
LSKVNSETSHGNELNDQEWRVNKIKLEVAETRNDCATRQLTYANPKLGNHRRLMRHAAQMALILLKSASPRFQVAVWIVRCGGANDVLLLPEHDNVGSAMGAVQLTNVIGCYFPTGNLLRAAVRTKSCLTFTHVALLTIRRGLVEICLPNSSIVIRVVQASGECHHRSS